MYSNYKSFFILVFIVAIFLISQSSTAQNKRLNSPERYLGLSAGATGSRLNFNPSVAQSYLLGSNAGISYRYIGHTFAGFQAELNYSQRGWKETNGLYSRSLDYIEIPFMTHFYFGDKFRLFLNVGPKISYLIAENINNNNPPATSATQHTETIQNKIDYGFCLGPGILFHLQKQVFLFDLRANYSINDVFSNAQRDFFDTSNNINVSVSLGWQFMIRP